MLSWFALIEASDPGGIDRRSKANWLKRTMSKIMRQNEGLRALDDCAKSAPSDVPDHSNAPASREMPNVISDMSVFTFTALRNRMKFALDALVGDHSWLDTSRR
nr:hypothetical protein [Tanacetum cinerariifolium]